MKKLSILLAFLAFAASSQAAIVSFDLQGTAGFGLLAGNEPQPLPFPTASSGGEIGSVGITYDTDTNLLNLTNVGWGSSQGFTDLSSTAGPSHIHGPVTVAQAATFTGTGPAIVTLNRSSNLVTGGTFTNPLVDLDTVFGATAETREAELLAGRWYINVHTANNPNGEIRGFLVPIPEPTSAALLGAASLVFLGRRRRS